MGRYDFTSPGAAAGNAILQFLIEREQLNRDRLRDELAAQREADDVRLRENELQFQKDQERRITERLARIDQAAATERDQKTALTRASVYDVGDVVDPADAEVMQRAVPGIVAMQQSLPARTLDAPTSLDGSGPTMSGVVLPSEPTGQMTYRGTAGQREAQLRLREAQRRLSAYLADPNVPDEVKAFLRAQESTGDTSLPAALFQTKDNGSWASAGSGMLYNTKTGEVRKIGGNPAIAPAAAGPSGEAYLQTLPPETQALVKQIADYKMDLSKVTSLRGGERERIAQMVAQYDPTFDMSQYASRVKMRGDFNTGKASQNIRSLNTAVGHLATLKEKADALENRSYPLWNRIANAAETGTGDPRVVAFNTAANAVEGELAALFKGTGATDQEIKAWRSALHSNQSPAQLTGAIATAIELMHSRLMALDDQWRQGMGKPRDFKILSDKSRATLQDMGVDIEAYEPNVTPPAVAVGGGSSFRLVGKRPK